MARKKPSEEPGGQPSPEPKVIQRYQPTLDPELAKDIGVIASLSGVSMSDWINSQLTPIVAEELPKALAKRGFKQEPK